MSAFVDAHDADRAVAANAQTGDGGIAWRKIDEAVQAQGVREHDVDRHAVREHGDTCAVVAFRNYGAEGRNNLGAESHGIAAEVANGVAEETLPFFVALRAQRLHRAIARDV